MVCANVQINLDLLLCRLKIIVECSRLYFMKNKYIFEYMR